MSQDPQDVAVGLEQPCRLLACMVEFQVGKEVAHKLGAFHAVGLDTVSLAPMAEHDVFAVEDCRVKGDFVLSVTHQWRKWRVTVADIDADRAEKARVQVKRNLNVLINRIFFNVDILSVDYHQVAFADEMPSRVPALGCFDSLYALITVEAKVADAVVEQGRGLWMGAQSLDIDMPFVGQGVLD